MKKYFKGLLFFILIIAIASVTSIGGWQRIYYAGWELMGKEKRHLLRDNVQKAQAEQTKASEEFKDALTRIKEIYGFQGGDLEKFYKKIYSDYKTCERRADDVSDRIRKVRQIASDLFTEWENELNQITNENLSAKSRQALEATKDRYERLHEAMAKAESSMKPVLKNLNNYVLYLKHNLNAQAIGALKREVDGIESEVQILIKDISRSVNEAEEFLKNLK